MNEIVARIVEPDTRRKNAKASPDPENSNFRGLAETALQGIIVHRDWKILYANRAAAHTLGYSDVDELVSVSNILRLFPQEEHARITGFRDARLRGEPAPERYHARLLHKNGMAVQVELLASVLDWQGEPALQSAFIDISESVRTQRLLRESQERYALAMEGGNEGMWDWHIDTDSLYVSPNVCRYLDIPVPEEPIKSDFWVDRLHPDDRAHARASLIAHLRGEDEY